MPQGTNSNYLSFIYLMPLKMGYYNVNKSLKIAITNDLTPWPTLAV